jgi:predicted DNA-binding transcriptional regulator AlpA
MNAEAEVLRIEDVAVLVNASTTTVFRWVRMGRFPKGISYGGFKTVGWSRATVEVWLADRNEAVLTGTHR